MDSQVVTRSVCQVVTPDYNTIAPAPPREGPGEAYFIWCQVLPPDYTTLPSPLGGAGGGSTSS